MGGACLVWLGISLLGTGLGIPCILWFIQAVALAVSMPPKKGMGKSKGKEPAKRPPARQAMPPSSSDEEEDEAAQQEILAKLAALERSRGVPSGQLSGARDQRASKRVSTATFQCEVLTHLSLLEGSTGAVAAQPGSLEAGGMADLEEQEAQEMAEGPPIAVVVDQPEPVGAVVRRGRCRILICGHSMIFWAVHQAKRTPLGSQLGLSRWA
ncbi:uncharacterized protein LOC129330021 [Eublepharis macularius]|uniref:Uncharacterized protein LOC129330021 n=1 Tax=Eublepharis macularius TaxID=481883 RepID=A0AA97KYH5_EUBMA|nr:uncharacterized protein LOC129330021 [Eublepharis macularius]